MNRAFRKTPLVVPTLLSLLVAVACGGSDDNNPSESSGGSGGSATATAGTSGSGNRAGSSNSGGATSGPGGGDFSTSVPGGKQIGDLSEAERLQLCDDVDEFFTSGSVASDVSEFQCRLSGLIAAAFGMADTDAAAQTACQAAYDECQAAPSETTQDCSPTEGMCTATVDELKACMSDTADALHMFKDAIPPCSELTLADLQGGPPLDAMDPASCTTLETKCPDAPEPPISSM